MLRRILKNHASPHGRRKSREKIKIRDRVRSPKSSGDFGRLWETSGDAAGDYKEIKGKITQKFGRLLGDQEFLKNDLRKQKLRCAAAFADRENNRKSLVAAVRSDGHTAGQTHPLIEMRGRI